jgi:hypothetical protein
MSGIKDQEKIDEMRRRLYERGGQSVPTPRHDLTPTYTPPTPASWDIPHPSIAVESTADTRDESLTEETVTVADFGDEPIKKESWRYSYRSIILLVTLGFFLLTLLGTGLYLFFGENQISNKNIGISITGPLSIGGGELLPLQVTVTNQNNVPIESALLIVNYPPSTKSAENNRDIFEERVMLDRIAAGEALNVPVRAVVFGEENQEYEVRATIEYRLVDSNGTFFKESEPLVFKITSSPLVIRVDAVNKISSGQDIEVKLNVQSNASNVLRDILIVANYPSNFDYGSSEPAPTYRETAWLIKELKPEQTEVITIKGRANGLQNEEFQMQFSAGTPRQDNQFILGSTLANVTADFFIERPFIDIGLLINNNRNAIVTAQTGAVTTFAVEVQNTLTETLYDMAVEVAISGNVLSREDVVVSNGFYDSIKDVIRFEVSGDRSLAEVSPGATRRFTFSISPGEQKQTPSFSVTANAFARRVSENRATEQIIGTAQSEVKYTSNVSLDRSVARASSDTGPVPPVADMVTTYTVSLETTAGGNDVTGTVVTTSLPQFVDWTNVTSGNGTIEFNPVSKEITWTIGEMKAGETQTRTFQVSLRPSQNQINQTPALVGVQRLSTTDKFTGAIIRVESATVSAELPGQRDSGRVARTVVESNDQEDN